MKSTLFILLAGLPLLAQTEARDKLNGTWHSDQGTWTIEPKTQNLHIVHDKGLDLECNTMGKECKTKVSGKQTRVSMWFSGPKLVVMETKGNEVVKRRFFAKDDQTMEVEVIPIVPAGQTETRTFQKVESTATASTKP